MVNKPKEKVDLINTKKDIKKRLNRRCADKYFHAPIVQKDCSKNYFLPERGIFSLPIRFVNYFYNLSYNVGKSISNQKSLEYFLTEVVNIEKLLQFMPQRPRENDNQSRRLWKAITQLTNKKKAKALITDKNQSDELNEMIEKSIKQGKKLTHFERIKDLKETEAI